MPTLVGITMFPLIRNVNSCWPTLVGMRRSSAETKAVILAAARERFAESGFERATIRAIAADAEHRPVDGDAVLRQQGPAVRRRRRLRPGLSRPSERRRSDEVGARDGRAFHGSLGTRRGPDRAAAVEHHQRRGGLEDAGDLRGAAAARDGEGQRRGAAHAAPGSSHRRCSAWRCAATCCGCRPSSRCPATRSCRGSGRRFSATCRSYARQ